MKLFSSLSTKLTVLYTLLFSLLSLSVFALTYNGLSKYLTDEINDYLLEEAEEANYIYRTEGLEAVFKEIHLETGTEGVEHFFIRIYNKDLNLVISSDVSNWAWIPDIQPISGQFTEPKIETIALSIEKAKAHILTYRLGEDYLLQIGASLIRGEQLLSRFRTLFFLSFILITGLAVGLSYLVAKRSLTGIEKVKKRSDEISRSNLLQIIPVDGSCDEVDNLTESFNRMQNRIHDLVQELQDVSNNIAHDLRSPVTRIRGLAETTLRSNASLDDYRELTAVIIEESDNLVRIINDMLEIAQMDSGAAQFNLVPVDLPEILTDIVEFYIPIAEDKKVDLELQIAPTYLAIPGDKNQLQRAIANLLDNALKFTPQEGTIKVIASKKNDVITLTIKDNGSGISSKDLPHIFDRFYRGDQSRSKPGNGLGLSMVEAITKGHNGQLQALSSPGQGTEMRLFFPSYNNPETETV